MTRFSGPGWRVAGAIAAWTLFTFSFTLLYQVAAVVSGLGGFCASGGPYVIATECPESVVAFAPLSIFGMLIAAAIALFFQRGFGMPVLVWAWPILFVGLGVEFLMTTTQPGGLAVGLLLGLLFVVMGLAPLIFELRAGLRRLVLGKTDVRGARFADREGAPRTLYSFGRDDGREIVTPTPAAWALSIVVSFGSIALGIWLGILAFAAVGSAR